MLSLLFWCLTTGVCMMLAETLHCSEKENFGFEIVFSSLAYARVSSILHMYKKVLVYRKFLQENLVMLR